MRFIIAGAICLGPPTDSPEAIIPMATRPVMH